MGIQSVIWLLREYIYPHIKFERNWLNIFRVSIGGHGGGDAKTMISLTTSFGDIINLLGVIIYGHILQFDHVGGSYVHPLKCVQWPILLGGALARMFGGSSSFLLTFGRKSIYLTYVGRFRGEIK